MSDDRLLEHIAALETKVRHFEEERRLWQAIARAAEVVCKSAGRGIVISWEVSQDLQLAVIAARTAGLTWDGEK